MDEFCHLIEFRVKPDFIGEFKQACKKMKVHAESESGLKEMKLYQNEKDKEMVYIFSRWRDADAFNQHKEKYYSVELYKLEEKILKTKPKSLILEENIIDAQQEAKPIAVDDKVLTLFLIFKFKDEYKDELLQAFAEYVPQTREENGNILFDVFTVKDSPDELVIYNIWRNSDDFFKVHINTTHKEKVGPILNDAMIGNMEECMNYVTEF